MILYYWHSLGRRDTTRLKIWFMGYVEHNQEMTLELLGLLKDQYDIILLAFPGEERHYQIEDLVYGVRYVNVVDLE